MGLPMLKFRWIGSVLRVFSTRFSLGKEYDGVDGGVNAFFWVDVFDGRWGIDGSWW